MEMFANYDNTNPRHEDQNINIDYEQAATVEGSNIQKNIHMNRSAVDSDKNVTYGA